MSDETIKLDGFAELDKALSELGKSTERGVLRRIAMKALEPVRDDAQSLAPVDEGDLRDSIIIGSRLNKNARRFDRQQPREGVRVFVGTNNRNGAAREFGSVRSRATPFLAPAWDANENRVLDYVKQNLGKEIEKTAARVAKKKGKG